jgi:hypothetical protein
MPGLDTSQATLSDTASVEALVAALYEVISGPAGSRDWVRMRALFWPGARLVRKTRSQDGGFIVQAETVDEFIEHAAAALEKTPFYERELARSEHRFGAIAQVFSTYESRLSLEQPAPMRGINSIQLLQHEERWWVVNLLWDDERDDNPIPEAFAGAPAFPIPHSPFLVPSS